MNAHGTLRALIMVSLATASFAGAAVQYSDEFDDVRVAFQEAGELHFGEEIPPEQQLTAFVEIFGPGLCWVDADGDGLDDLFVVSQQFNALNPFTTGWIDNVDPHNRLFINDGDGGFTERTREAGIEGRTFAFGCSAADYDGDGDVDLYVSAFGDAQWGGNQLYRNRGDGTFDDVSDEAGIGMLGACGDFACMSTTSSWGDYDLDGDLDLYVANYVETDLLDEWHGPGAHVAQANFLHRNNGDGTFTEVAEAAGVAGEAIDVGGSKSLGLGWFDYDLDGDLDLFVANDQEPNDFYENNGDGTFEDRSIEAGVDDVRAGMGVAIGDYDGDAFPDIFITHYQDQLFGFYRNNQDGTFEDRSGEDDMHRASEHVGWGVAFLDFDRDGDLDLSWVNGHTVPFLDNYNAPKVMLRNDPEAEPVAPWDRLWVHVSDEVGLGAVEHTVGRGAAFADYDLDGDTDIAVGNNANQSMQFLRATGVENHWLNVRLVQDGLNRFAIGAKVKLEAEGLAPQFREVQAGSSYLSQNTLQQEFGLGGSLQADRITVTWPDGGTTIVENVAADQTIRIERAGAVVVNDVVSPLTRLLASVPERSPLWFDRDVEVSLIAEDRGSPTVSGLVSVEAALGDDPLAPYAGQTWSFTDEGVQVVRGRASDVAGNVEPVRTFRVGIDRTPPEAHHRIDGTAGANGWFVDEPAKLVLEASDSVSAVDRIHYRVDGGDWGTYRGPITVDEEGVTEFEYFAVDLAENAGPIQSVAVMLDRVSPVVSITSPARGSVNIGDVTLTTVGLGPSVVVPIMDLETYVRNVHVAADPGDETSGVWRLLLAVDGEVIASDTVGPEWAWEWRVNAVPSGLHELHVIVLDVAGNVGFDSLDLLLINVGREDVPDVPM